MEIGLFFGSFNPIHIGHMIIAQTMLENAGIGELWFVVSPQNPFKKNKSLLHEFDRFDMVEAAALENPKFKVSDVEFHMPKPSYTIDTLVVLSEKHPNHNFRLIVGGDNMNQFHKWKNSDQIIENFGLLIYPRPGQDINVLPQHKNICYIEAPMLEISATFIRNAIKKRHSIKYLVPESVENHIYRKGFYQ